MKCSWIIAIRTLLNCEAIWLMMCHIAFNLVSCMIRLYQRFLQEKKNGFMNWINNVDCYIIIVPICNMTLRLCWKMIGSSIFPKTGRFLKDGYSIILLNIYNVVIRLYQVFLTRSCLPKSVISSKQKFSGRRLLLELK